MAGASPRAHAQWLAHALDPRSNPLRRTSDCVTASITVLLLALILLAVPFSAVLGNVVYEQQKQAAAAEAVLRRPVEAQVTEPPRLAAVSHDPTYPAEWLTKVSWTGADGAPRAGEVPVKWGSKVGEAVPLWVGADERITPPPRTEQQVLGTTVVAAVSVMLSAQFFCVLGIMVTWRVAGALAHRAWRREWEIVQPDWTHRG